MFRVQDSARPSGLGHVHEGVQLARNIVDRLEDQLRNATRFIFGQLVLPGGAIHRVAVQAQYFRRQEWTVDLVHQCGMPIVDRHMAALGGDGLIGRLPGLAIGQGFRVFEFQQHVHGDRRHRPPARNA